MATHLNKSLKTAINDYIDRYGLAALLELIATVLENKPLLTNLDIIEAKGIREFVDRNYETD